MTLDTVNMLDRYTYWARDKVWACIMALAEADYHRDVPPACAQDVPQAGLRALLARASQQAGDTGNPRPLAKHLRYAQLAAHAGAGGDTTHRA